MQRKQKTPTRFTAFEREAMTSHPIRGVAVPITWADEPNLTVRFDDVRGWIVNPKESRASITHMLGSLADTLSRCKIWTLKRVRDTFATPAQRRVAA